jgi:hypothetical protein
MKGRASKIDFSEYNPDDMALVVRALEQSASANASPWNSRAVTSCADSFQAEASTEQAQAEIVTHVLNEVVRRLEVHVTEIEAVRDLAMQASAIDFRVQMAEADGTPVYRVSRNEVSRDFYVETKFDVTASENLAVETRHERANGSGWDGWTYKPYPDLGQILIYVQAHGRVTVCLLSDFQAAISKRDSALRAQVALGDRDGGYIRYSNHNKSDGYTTHGYTIPWQAIADDFPKSEGTYRLLLRGEMLHKAIAVCEAKSTKRTGARKSS